MKYILDINFILDTITNRCENSQEYSSIIEHCISNDTAYISSSSLHHIRFLIKKYYDEYSSLYFTLEKYLKIAKTPSYIDPENSLFKDDIEDYLVELSAKSIDAKIITSDRKFLKNSIYTISPNDYFLQENKPANIDFANLKKQYFMYQSEIEKEIDKVLNNASFIMGDAVRELEENLCKFTGSKYAITCSSGTDALLLAMMALDIKPGDEIITTPFTFIATAETIALLGAKPVFVDIDEKTYNIDISKIESAITPKTKAIIAVSLYGQPCDLDAINEIIKKVEGRRQKVEGIKEKGESEKINSSPFTLHPSPSIKLIVDGAQSFGAIYKGKSEVHFADIYTTSFFPAKPLGCFGDGGAVFTNDEKLAQKIKMLRVHGQNKRYHHKYIGLGGRMDTIQCAIVDVKLKYYDKDLKLRQEVAKKYTNILGSKTLVLPLIDKNCTSAFAQYSIRVQNRDKLQDRLKEIGIPTAVHYPMPLHLQECFSYLGYKKGDFPIAEKISDEILSLPMNPYLSDEEIKYISENIIVK